MLGKTLGLARRPSDPLAETALLWPSATQLYSEGPIVDRASPLPNANVLERPAVNFLTTRDILSVFGEDGPGWRGEFIRGIGLFLKRGMDVVGSSLSLLFLWPLMLMIAIATKLGSPGPVIYRSLRVGKGGRKFDCYKFRTMVAGSDGLKEALRARNQRRGPFFKIADDPRVTPLGQFLRKYSLDELPQLWNVLKGEMSLVGPRPHPVEDCAQYRPEHCQRFLVKPGLTGLWQVMARANPSFETCMMLDLGYIEAWSLLLDCKILMKTIPAVLAGEGQ